jgi:putative ABC transport system ATP-binding protein
MGGGGGRGYFSERADATAGRATFLLDAVGIGNLANAFPPELSGGEMRRVLIARALMNDPALLIADEPTSDLDRETTEEVMTLFSKINKEGTTILMVTHEEGLLRYGGRVMRMGDGRLSQCKGANG